MDTLIVPAPAKLNLFLHVTGRRDDGFHTLETLFVALDHGDTIELSLRDDAAIIRRTEHSGVAPDQDLAVRAAHALQRESGTPLGVEIALTKRIPAGGGLGGGSSDAASVLLALNRLWRLNWPRARLMTLGLGLGADVPFFVFGRPALARGVGEQLTAVSLPARWYAVIVPPVAVATATVFADRELTRDTPSAKINVFSEGYGRNDLQPIAVARFPDIAEALAGLRERSQQARMTGSGSCVYAPFASEAEAQAAFEARPSMMHGFVARSLAVHPLVRFA